MKPPLPEEEYIQILKRTFESDERELSLDIKLFDAYILVGLLQFSYRNLPGRDSLRDYAERLGRQFQQAVAQATTGAEIDAIMELGWNPAYDVDRDGNSIDPEEIKPAKTELHNCWAIYGLNEDGSEAETALAEFRRPQDWGHPRWSYHFYKFENDQYINHCHCWTDLEREEYEYAKLFGSLIIQILYPGERPEFCGRDFLREEDFWVDEWGPAPPVIEEEEENEYWWHEDNLP
jgi:hypothetical protein